MGAGLGFGVVRASSAPASGLQKFADGAVETGAKALTRLRPVWLECGGRPTPSALAFFLPRGEAGQPMLASEDFGVFGRVAPSALMLLGPEKAHRGCTIRTTIFPMR